MPCTARAKRSSVWEELSDEEKQNEFELHSIQHDLIREIYGPVDAHDKIEKMSDEEYKDFFRKVIQRYRHKRKRLSNYLRQEGRTAQADAIDAETEQQITEAQKS